jgi:hypothetical protein
MNRRLLVEGIVGVIFLAGVVILACGTKKMDELEYDRYFGIAVSKAVIVNQLPAGKGLYYKPSVGISYLVCRLTLDNQSSSIVHIEPGNFTIHSSDNRVFTCDETVSSAQSGFLGVMDLGAGEKIEGMLAFDIQEAESYKLVFKTFNREITKKLEIKGEL